MKPFSQEALSAEEYEYKLALDDCQFFGIGFNDTYRRGERAEWLDSSITLEHRPNQKKMNDCLDRLFSAMVELKLKEEIEHEKAA